MHRLMPIAIFAVVASTALCLGQATAGDTVSMESAQYYIQDHAGMIEMEDGHSIIFARWYGTQVNEDASSVMHHAKLDCAGMIDARPDGSWDANGYCMHTDRDGDQWVGKWRNGSAMEAAVYEIYNGVTGKYVGASGGGTAKCTDLVTGSRGNTVCDITGEIALK